MGFRRKVFKGEARHFRKGQLLATKWHDKRDVYLLSTTAQARNKLVTRSRHQDEVLLDFSSTISCMQYICCL